MTENCKSCKVVDDENHRLNNCDLWRERNYLDKNYKANFNDIYSNDFVVLNKSIMEIQSVWALQYTSGRMKRPSSSLDVNPMMGFLLYFVSLVVDYLDHRTI